MLTQLVTSSVHMAIIRQFWYATAVAGFVYDLMIYYLYYPSNQQSDCRAHLSSNLKTFLTEIIQERNCIRSKLWNRAATGIFKKPFTPFPEPGSLITPMTVLTLAHSTSKLSQSLDPRARARKPLH